MTEKTRRVGPIGRALRVVTGLTFIYLALADEDWKPAWGVELYEAVLGLVVFPAVMLAIVLVARRRSDAPLRLAGPVAEISLTLAQFVSEIAARHRGSVVKMLGDGVHFHFRDPGDAVRASLEVVERAPSQGLPPAHVGVNAGPMIYDEGDYFGRTVNIAARIASHAKANQVLIGENLERSVDPARFRLVELGPVQLKGITEPVTIYQAVRD
jgi:class 3 adenylate cyclase